MSSGGGLIIQNTVQISRKQRSLFAKWVVPRSLVGRSARLEAGKTRQVWSDQKQVTVLFVILDASYNTEVSSAIHYVWKAVQAKYVKGFSHFLKLTSGMETFLEDIGDVTFA